MYGYGDFKAYILSLLSPFPDMMISVDHFCVIGDEKAGYRAATRWTMQGTHTGPGVYGKATGKRINIIGVTQQLVQNERITREWTLFDEFALLKQLYTPD
jgi:predicted ester cyclase